MFEPIKIAESTYEGDLEPSYIKPPRSDANRAGHSRKIGGEYALPNTYSGMIESAGKHRKRYLDYMEDISKQTCLICGSENLSDEC